MTKDVLVRISGLQSMAGEMEHGEDEPIEIIHNGTYYFKGGVHYIFYEEILETAGEVTKTRIRLTGTDTLEVTRTGAANTNMVFENNKSTHCFYRTPFGQLNLEICTKQIFFEESPNNINIRADYHLDVNFEPMAECTVRINVRPRGEKDFSLKESMNF